MTYEGDPVVDNELCKSLPDDLRAFYREVNGIVAYKGGLHIRGCVLEPKWHSLRRVWHGEWALYRSFSVLRSSDIPFAQDCLGDQFFWRLGTVWRLFWDSGEIEDLEIEFFDFLEDIQADPVDYLDLEPLVFYLDQGHHLDPGKILISDPPLSVESDHYEFKSLDIESFLS